MMRLGYIVALLFCLASCKTRQIETTIDVHKETEQQQFNGISTSLDSSSVEVSTIVDEVNDVVEDVVRVTYYEDGVISRVEEHSRKTDNSTKHVSEDRKENECILVAVDTTSIVNRYSYDAMQEYKAESKPSASFVISYWILYILIAIIAFGMVKYRKELFRL